MGLDRHLFLIDTNKLNLTGLTAFYRLLLRTWSRFMVSREPRSVRGLWLREEPLLFNSAMDLDILKSDSLRKALWSANITKIGHLVSEGQ